MRKKLCLTLCCWLALITVACADASVKVEGNVASPGEWSVPTLRKTFEGALQTVHYNLKGTPHEATCLPLWTLLQAAHPQFNPSIHNDFLGWNVSVYGSDGYVVCFSLGELCPDQGKAAVWVTLDQDGAPLPDAASPIRLIVPGDAKPSRWIYSIVRIHVQASSPNP